MNQPTPPPIDLREPTGLPAWPIGLVAGVEKSGKTLKLAEASASDLIHDTYWIGCGEDDPDEYGALPGARFKIVRHDGTYRGMLNALTAARLQPPGPDGKPNLLVLDSGTRSWDMLKDMAQATQHERFHKKHPDAPVPDEGIKPTSDLWNTANDRWDHIINELRAHQGPSLITARLEYQVIMDSAGQPTKEKHWKVIGQKYLPYDVGFIVQMRGAYPEVDNYLTGVRSLRYQHKKVRGKAVAKPLPDDFTIDGVWRMLGLEEKVADRQHAHVRAVGDEHDRRTRAELLEQIRAHAEVAQVDTREVGQRWAAAHNGQPITDASDFEALAAVRDDLAARAAARTAEIERAQAEQAAARAQRTEHAQPATATAHQPAPAGRAPEPTAPVEHAQAEQAPAREPEPVVNQRQAPDPGETRTQQSNRFMREEVAYQAEILGVPAEAYAGDVFQAEGPAMLLAARQLVVPARAEIIGLLRERGRGTEADAYERAGQGFPFDVVKHVIDAESFTREPAEQPAREPVSQ